MNFVVVLYENFVTSNNKYYMYDTFFKKFITKNIQERI